MVTHNTSFPVQNSTDLILFKLFATLLAAVTGSRTIDLVLLYVGKKQSIRAERTRYRPLRTLLEPMAVHIHLPHTGCTLDTSYYSMKTELFMILRTSHQIDMYMWSVSITCISHTYKHRLILYHSKHTPDWWLPGKSPTSGEKSRKVHDMLGLKPGPQT